MWHKNMLRFYKAIKNLGLTNLKANKLLNKLLVNVLCV